MGKKNKGKAQLEQDSGTRSKAPREVRSGPSSSGVNLLLVIIALIPFTYSNKLMDPVLTLRYALFASLVLLTSLFFLIYRSKINLPPFTGPLKWVFILGLAFGAWNLIPMFLATNKQQVYYELGRHFLNISFLFSITCLAFLHKDLMIKISRLLVIAGIIHGLIGLFQFYDIGFRELPGNFVPYGLMGNRNFFGSAQVLLVPFAISCFIGSSKSWRWVSVIAIIMILSSAIISQTRSSWLAGLAIIISAMALVLIYLPQYRKKWIVGTAIGIATIIAITMMLVLADKDNQLRTSLSERTASILNAESSDTSSAAMNIRERLKIWSKTAELIGDHLLTGVGPDNWKIVVPKYGSEGMIFAKGDYFADTTHNEYLSTLAESGLPGAILFYGMWVLILLLGLRALRKTQDSNRKLVILLLVSGLLGFAVDAFFSFPLHRIEHSIYLYLSGGILLAFYLKEQPIGNASQVKRSWIYLMAGIAIVNLVIAFGKISFEKHYYKSKAYYDLRNYQHSIEEGNKAKSNLVNIGPDNFPVENYTALSYQMLGKYPEAIREIDRALVYHPYNKNLLINKGVFYYEMKQFNKALENFLKARDLAPEMDIIHQNLGATYFELKDFRSAVESFKSANLASKPNLVQLKKQAEDSLSILQR